MPIHFACPSCGRTLEAEPAQPGTTAACAGCGRRVPVPALGILVGAAPRGTSTKPPAQPPVLWRVPLRRRIGGALIGACVLLAAIGTAVGWHFLAARPAGVREPGPTQMARSDTHAESAKAPAPRAEPPVESRSTPAPVRPAEKPASAAPRKLTPPGPNAMKPFVPVWRLKEGDTFYQELTVGQKSNLRVQGVAAASQLQYRVVSRFTVQKAGPDGSLVVGQKIERAKLLQADTLTKSLVGDAVGRLPGTKFQMKLNPDREVIDFQGEAGQPLAGGFQVAGGQGMNMASLLDRDGWKELAQATFFNRDRPLTADARWSKPMTHHWGPLGTWAGQIRYTYAGPEGAAHKITYAMQLTHKPPAPGGLVMGLPITGAKFQAQEAVGLLYFDPARGRVKAAEERFRVRGVLGLQLLGQNTPLEIDEEQHFQIRITDSLDP